MATECAPTLAQCRDAYAASRVDGLSLRETLEQLELTVEDYGGPEFVRALVRDSSGRDVYRGTVGGAWAWLRGEEVSRG